MSLFKIRRNLSVGGILYVGAQGNSDSGFVRTTNSTLRAFSGAGTGSVGTLLANVTGVASGSADYSGGVLEVPHDATAAAGTGNLANDGQIAVHASGGTIQLAFVCNGSVIVWSALAGTGAVTSAVAS